MIQSRYPPCSLRRHGAASTEAGIGAVLPGGAAPFLCNLTPANGAPESGARVVGLLRPWMATLAGIGREICQCQDRGRLSAIPDPPSPVVVAQWSAHPPRVAGGHRSNSCRRHSLDIGRLLEPW